MGRKGARDILVNGSRETKGDGPKGAIGCEPSEPGKHGNATVLELGFPHPIKGGKTRSFFPGRRLNESSEVFVDGGKVEGVKSDISNVGSIKVDRTGEERHGLGTLSLINHGVPHALRHGFQRGLDGALLSGSECGGRYGEEGGDGKLHHGDNYYFL